jgi:hypothetical protein
MESGVIVENEAYKLGNALAIEGRALVQGGLILGAADTGKGKDTKTTKGSPDNHATKAKEKGAAKPPSNGAEKPGSVGIFIGEKGKLTLLGGEVDGTMIMPDISHFEDQRKPEPQKSTST